MRVFRQTNWSVDTGFYLNGRSTKILGAANHQDFAGVGVAVPDRLQPHRIAKLNAREKALKAAEADQRQRQQDDAMLCGCLQ